MLTIENLKAKIEEKEILKGLNLDIKPGEVHAIMGPNGSGKSTLSNILSGKKGYENSGEIVFDGENLNDISIEERAHNFAWARLQKAKKNVENFDWRGYPIVSKEQVNLVYQGYQQELEVANYIYTTLELNRS